MSNTCTRLHRIFTTTLRTQNPITSNSKPKTQDQIQSPQILGSNNTLDPQSSALVNNLLKEKTPEKLLKKFTLISKHGFFRRQRKLYDFTIHRLTLAKQFPLIEQALESQKKYMRGEGFAARIIALYGKAGMFKHANQVFDEMPQRKCQRGIKSFNALLGAAVNSQQFEIAYKLFREMPTKISVDLDDDSYCTAANALCKMGLIDEAASLLDEMENKGVKPSAVIYNTIIGALYGKGDYVEGEKMWDRMIENGVEPDLCSYSYKMEKFVYDGELSKAISMLEELKSKGLKPNVVVFNALLQGFCKNDDLDEVRKWYDELLKFGCIPNIGTFDILVPFLCEKGDYDFAFKVCYKKLKRLCTVDEASLQKVVDGLVKNSMIKEAETLVKLARSHSYYPYNLEMPSDV